MSREELITITINVHDSVLRLLTHRLWLSTLAVMEQARPKTLSSQARPRTLSSTLKCPYVMNINIIFKYACAIFTAIPLLLHACLVWLHHRHRQSLHPHSCFWVIISFRTATRVKTTLHSLQCMCVCVCVCVHVSTSSTSSYFRWQQSLTLLLPLPPAMLLSACQSSPPLLVFVLALKLGRWCSCMACQYWEKFKHN